MSREPLKNPSLVWWVQPGIIGGMPMPWVHPDRRENLGGGLNAYEDELPLLSAEGVRALVCLLNIPGDDAVYRSAGFQFHLMPVKDGSVPTVQQMKRFLHFMDEEVGSKHPVVVHCEAGLGRTGTVIASYLIAKGMPPQAAIQQVRSVRPQAIETRDQVDFLHMLPASLNQLDR